MTHMIIKMKKDAKRKLMTKLNYKLTINLVIIYNFFSNNHRKIQFSNLLNNLENIQNNPR